MPVHLALGVHNHQPVGNFEWVLENHYRTAYLPFLQVMEAASRLPFSMHTSGPLLQWLTQAHPDYVERVRALVEGGRVELKGGCLYEAILPLICREDRADQLEGFSALLEATCGARPVGAWLPERVWEPSLARDLAEAGLQYAVVDDSHFASAGKQGPLSWGYYLTEDQGYRFDLFPISKDLRYLIPFHEPAETVTFLREVHEEDERARAAGDLAPQTPPPILVYDDDGEKFGGWPNTAEHVYGAKWLERFLGALEEAEGEGWLLVTTPGAYRREFGPLGHVYLPPASYAEMLEWSGGFFRNFLSRYEEANRLHKRMLEVSTRSRAPAAAGPQATAARDAVLRAQCNDVYWHGVFGGLYLPHLRQAAYANLLAAEDLLPPGPPVSGLDIDFDGGEEVRLRSHTLLAFVSPARGGSLMSLDHLPSRAALLDTLRRRHEAEHERLLNSTAGSEPRPSGVASIHDHDIVSEIGLKQHLNADRSARDSLLDHFYAPGFTWENLLAGSVEDLTDLPRHGYAAELGRGERPAVRLTSSTVVARHPITLVKEVELADEPSRLLVSYQITVGPPISAGGIHGSPKAAVSPPRAYPQTVFFVPEFNLNLLGAWSADYGVLIDGKPPASSRLADGGTHAHAARIALVDGNRRLHVELGWPDSPRATVHRYGVVTVSLSEKGFEKIAQATCLAPAWSLALSPGCSLSLRLVLTVSQEAGRGTTWTF